MTRDGTPSLGSMIQSFFQDHLIDQRRASPCTIAAYRDGLRLFLVFAAELHDTTPSSLRLAQLDRETVLAFLRQLESRRGNAVRTRNARLAAIRAFFRHVAYRDPGTLGSVERVLSIQGKRHEKAAISYLAKDELDALLAAPDRNTAAGRRWYALLFFLSRTGARVSEAIGVNEADLTLTGSRQVLLRGKGSKHRVVPLDRATAKTLLGLPRAVADLAGVPVFTNARGGRLSRHGAIYILQEAAAIAARTCSSLVRKRVSPHTLRHTLAMQLLQAGVDLIVIQAWLGHATIATTHGYVEADVEMKRRALEMAAVIERAPAPYRPPDTILQILETLC